MPSETCPECGNTVIIKRLSMRGWNKIKCRCGEILKVKGRMTGFEVVEK